MRREFGWGTSRLVDLRKRNSYRPTHSTDTPLARGMTVPHRWRVARCGRSVQTSAVVSLLEQAEASSGRETNRTQQLRSRTASSSLDLGLAAVLKEATHHRTSGNENQKGQAREHCHPFRQSPIVALVSEENDQREKHTQHRAESDKPPEPSKQIRTALAAWGNGFIPLGAHGLRIVRSAHEQFCAHGWP